MNWMTNIMNKPAAANDKSKVLQLSDAAQREFIKFIQDRVGVLIKPNHRELMKVITTVCQDKQYTPMEYLQDLKAAGDDTDMLNKLVSAVTIGETYFFRDQRQMTLLQQTILPNIINRKIAQNNNSIRIWSAGCSSGEEIYTIVMLLKDLLPDYLSWNLSLLATDINIDVLKKAISGRYSEWSMRSIPTKYLDQYFTKEGQKFKLSDEIINKVTFDYLNLHSDSYPSLMNGTVSQDLIICRNVLIYFDNHHIKMILNRLDHCLAENGYLLLGASDPIAFMDVSVKSYENIPSLFIKQSDANTLASANIIKKADRISAESHVMIPNKVTRQTNSVSTDKYDIETMLNNKKWEEIIYAVDQIALNNKLDSHHMTAKATALANIGKTQEAITLCEDVINRDKMNKEAYFTYALCLAEINQWQAAELAFRKALYIDPNYILCRYQYGLFLIRINKTKEGIKALQVIINSASQFQEDSIVPDSQNMRYKELVAILKNEINLYLYGMKHESGK